MEPAFGRYVKRNFKTKAALGEIPVETLSDMGSNPIISTKREPLSDYERSEVRT